MDCRHTVPDWHRYVAPEGVTSPIMAGCRLLVKDGEPARDVRAIACAYWGRQRQCPMYEGPDARREALSPGTRSAPEETPLAGESAWPVRGPHAADGFRALLIALRLLAAALLCWSLGLGLLALFAGGAGRRVAVAAVVAAGVSLVTLGLEALTAWAGR
jgi:hypothetical protein